METSDLFRGEQTAWLHTHLPRLRAGDPDLISVKVPGQKIRYATWVSLRSAQFVVHERGRLRTLQTGQRNVHAWVRGALVLELTAEELSPVRPVAPVMDFPPPSYRTALYDPFKGGSFVDSETLQPLTHADWVIMSGKHVWYANG